VIANIKFLFDFLVPEKVGQHVVRCGN